MVISSLFLPVSSYPVLMLCRNLPNVLRHVESLRQRIQDWPPRNAGGDGRGLVGIMDDEMGFVD